MKKPEEKETRQVCAICQKPRVFEWSGKWTATERLFLIALLAKIQREESAYNKSRLDCSGEWKHASPDHAWMQAIVQGLPESISIADLIVKTVVIFDPDINLDAWIKDIERRVER